MAETLISMLIERLVSTTYEYMEGKVKLVLNVKKDVEEFAANLQAIQAVLEDAEQRQVKEANVRTWLEKLKDISYEMGDVLDEWNTDILKKQVEKQENEDANSVAVVPKKKVSCSIYPRCFCFGQVSRVIHRHDIALKIKDLNEKLSVIDKQRSMYNFQLAEKKVEQPERLKTSSYVEKSEVFGRENEKASLIKKLVSSDSSEEGRGILIIPIVGMGGMGKTTLTQLAYNDDTVKTHFEKRIWVCVSDPFDEIRIAKAISGDDNPTSSNELNTVLECMCKSIEGKRFLLVLDDVWTQDHKKWKLLKVPLIQSGAKGSRILVTTRKHEVANTMGAKMHTINLGGLSEQVCLSIFKHMASVDEDFDKSNVFGDIGKELVKRCKGLPLAAQTLGSLMRDKRTRIEWQNVLNSKIWDLKEVEQEVFQPLLLSYYDLDPAVKCCLLYCAIFPKDYEFKRDYLINLWMAQDYLNSGGNKDMGMIGHKYFENLVARSFFQDFKKDDDSGKIVKCKMHDIVHDFVQFLTKKECLIVEANGATKELEELGDKVRHLSLTSVPDDGPLPHCISSYINCQSLRTLSTFSSSITTIDSNFVLQMKCLRTLNLSHNKMKELPKEIGELVHLRHLDLSSNDGLEILPDAICDLCNLYTLDLSWCRYLRKLPEKMGKLINLKHLYVGGCDKLEYLPKGIGRLRSTLRRLDVCRLFFWESGDKDQALQFADLRSLNLIEGRLRIRIRLGNDEISEVEKAQLWDMKQLSHLSLYFEQDRDTSDFEDVEYRDTRSSTVEILNGLRPHQDLESLTSWCHNGITWPNWMTSLHNLRFLDVGEWTECETLPPLGKLPSLERLSMHKMWRVKKVGGEFLGIEEEDQLSFKSSISSFFPKLKQLQFKSLGEWEEWKGVEGWKKEDSDSEITIMPCLSSLEILWCDKLTTLPDFLFKTPLKNLEIYRCDKLSRRYREGSGEEWPKISHIPNIKI